MRHNTHNKFGDNDDTYTNQKHRPDNLDLADLVYLVAQLGGLNSHASNEAKVYHPLKLSSLSGGQGRILFTPLLLLLVVALIRFVERQTPKQLRGEVWKGGRELVGWSGYLLLWAILRAADSTKPWTTARKQEWLMPRVVEDEGDLLCGTVWWNLTLYSALFLPHRITPFGG